MSRDLRHTIEFTDESTPTRRAKPAGGGVVLDRSGSASFTGNTISRNTAGRESGAILLENTGGSRTAPTRITRNAIIANTAGGHGGAIYIFGNRYYVLSGNRICGNRTNLSGGTGGIFVTDSSQSVSLAGDTQNRIYNWVLGNNGYWIYNDNPFRATGENDIDARNMVWGTNDPEAIEACIYDYYDNTTKAEVYWWPIVRYLPGDLNYDCVVDQADLATLLANWGCTGPGACDGDADCDGDTDQADLAILLANFGLRC